MKGTVAYYNEFDPNAAAWIRELIKDGLVAPGDVDERSITEVKPHELKGYTQCHFFAGIAGWSYALRLARVPDSKRIWTASLPCQPLSCAGEQAGHADERHLWPAFYYLVSECGPSTIIGEQVASKDGREWFAGIRADLEGIGYACGCADLCAAGVSAPHLRQRLYWLAHSRSRRGEEGIPEPKQWKKGFPKKPDYRGGGIVVPVAHSNGGNASTEGLQRSGKHGLKPEDGGVDRLEHAESDGRKQRRAESGGRGAAGGCGDVRLGDSTSPGLHASTHGGIHCGEEGAGTRNGESERSGDAGAMANTGHEPEGRPSRCAEAEGRRSLSDASGCGPWGNFSIIPCRDGKARRVESGVEPLVAGLPRGVVPSGDPSGSYAQATAEARNVRLRGYGNAIVAPLAAEFIKSALEAIGDAFPEA